MRHSAYDRPAVRARRSWLASVDWLDMLKLVLFCPFRLLAAIWRIGIRTAFGLVDGLFYGFMGFMGLGIICFVGYGLYRVVLYPFFHH